LRRGKSCLYIERVAENYARTDRFGYVSCATIGGLAVMEADRRGG